MVLTAQYVQRMISHWLRCPPNGYLGSSYGSGVQDLLQMPFTQATADALVAKLRTDVPPLNLLPASAFNVWSRPTGADGVNLFIEVAGVEVFLGEAAT